MLKNYLITALRTLRRNLIYSFINVIGLAIGITASILILLWVYDEMTFNKYFRNYETLYEIKQNSITENGVATRNFVPMPLKDILLEKDSRMKRMSITVNQSALISVGDRKVQKVGMDVSESFLKMFEFDMIRGNPDLALSDPRSIVLTRSTATALFGDTDPLGKMVTVKIETNEELKVTGVIADPPSNISFRLDFLLPFAYFEATSVWVQHARDNWNNNGFQMYVELEAGADKTVVDHSIQNVIVENSSEATGRELFLHSMSRWRLYNKFENGKEAGGLIEYVMLFAGIAVLTLIIACINFMNLATAHSEHRAREVGVRKSVGSRRAELIVQFLSESILIATIALLFALVLVELSLPFYNILVDKNLSIDYASWPFGLFSIVIIFVTGLLAGSYPAFYLSSFQPAKVLKGKVTTGKHGRTPRQVMVTLQFGFSMLLIIGTVVIYQQIQFLKQREVGYDRENLMMIWSTSNIEKNFKTLKQELLNTGAAQAVCKSNSPITNIFSSSPLDSWTGMQAGQRIEVTNIATEYDYTKTMGIRMLEGRDFSEEFKSDTAAIILNKKAVSVLNLSNPIGDKIQMWGSTWNVIGVMEDVLMGSSSRNIEPLVMTMDPTWSSTISVRVAKSDDLPTAIKRIEDVFKKYNPDYPFEYRFVSSEFERKFTTINMISSLAGSFTLLAIFITGLGLFGMAAFTAEQRTKEIGLRKVMGASVPSLVILLSKDFSKLVILAFVISAPLAWWAVSDFLQQYQIHIEVPLWVFPLAGVASLVITIAIVGTQAVRAAMRNPVVSLRSE